MASNPKASTSKKKSATIKKQATYRRLGVLMILVLFIFLLCRGCDGKKSATQGAISTASVPQTTDDSHTEPGVASTTPALETQPVQTEAATTRQLQLTDSVPDAYSIAVTPVLQNPELPTGCEITSLTTVLNYLGFPVDKTDIADNSITYADSGSTTFDKAFIGSPYDPTSFGCFAPVIQEAAEKYLADQPGSSYQVYDLTGSDQQTVLQYVASGYPVIIWVSINLMDTEGVYYWTDPEGNDAVWIVNEHCVVLTGYDQNAGTVTVADPLNGTTVYDMNLFFQRYQELQQQALVIA